MDDTYENLTELEGEISEYSGNQVLFKLAELQRIKLEPDEVLSVKLIGDDFDAAIVSSIKRMLNQVFTKNKVMIFSMPPKTDILFEAIKQEPAKVASYCSDCDCGKKEGCQS